ncbi:Tartrate-resistant acid phosphatase type 5 [Podochytrium sp. JEL0797]|nr:Tartrate-resistant acid phosphatase type 5 [Podochytrium sp. JEL0797]
MKILRSVAFLIIGDWGNQMDLTGEDTVATTMNSWAEKRNTTAVISLGDNFYKGGIYDYDGVESEEDPKFAGLWGNVFNGSALGKIPWWLVLGNHDWYTLNSYKFELGFQNPLWNLPDFFWTRRVEIEAGTGVFATFVFIETDLLQYGYHDKEKGIAENFVNAGWNADAHSAEKQLAWLDNALLEANQDAFVFVAGHHGCFSCAKDVNDSKFMTNVRGLVDKWQVTAYMHGHHHTLAYYRTNNNMTLHVQSGAGGNLAGSCKPVHPAVGNELTKTYGFAHLRVHPEFAEFDFVSESNEVAFSASIAARTPVIGTQVDATYLVDEKDVAIVQIAKIVSKKMHFFCTLLFAQLTFSAPAPLPGPPAPQPKPPSSTNFLLIGDWGVEGGAPVAHAMSLRTTPRTQAILSLGDNFYRSDNHTYDGVRSTNDPKFTHFWQNAFAHAPLSSLPWWLVLGNHDWIELDSHRHEMEFRHARWSLPDLFYTKRVKIHTTEDVEEETYASFVFIETDLFQYGYNASSGNMSANFDSLGWAEAAHTMEKQLAWIDNALFEANEDAFVFVVGHHGGFACDKDVVDSVAMQNVTDLVNKWKATAYIHGHHHTLSYSYTNQNVTLQVQVGSGGNLDKTCPPVEEEGAVGQEFLDGYGFARLTLTRDQAKFEFISDANEDVFDAFMGPRVPVAANPDKTWLASAKDGAVHFAKHQREDKLLLQE